MSTMPPTRRKPPKKADAADIPEFYDWDLLVEEAHVGVKPYVLRRKLAQPTEDGETHEMITIPVPSGSSYINLAAAQQRNDVAGILVNLAQSGETEQDNAKLFDKLMLLMSKADFPIVDKLAEGVLRHYFSLPPRKEDGSEGGAGESSAS